MSRASRRRRRAYGSRAASARRRRPSRRAAAPVDDHELAVEPVDGAQPVVTSGERFSQGGDPVEAAVEQDMRSCSWWVTSAAGQSRGSIPRERRSVAAATRGASRVTGAFLRAAELTPALRCRRALQWADGWRGIPGPQARRAHAGPGVAHPAVDPAVRRGVRSALRLGLVAAYSVVFMWGGFFDWAGSAETILWSLGVVLWIAVAALLVREPCPAIAGFGTSP